MTPAQIFENYGSDIKCPFEKGDIVTTPSGLGKIICQFTRGLRWWVETSKGTYTAETINRLNEK